MRIDLLAKQILDRLKSLDKDTDKTNLIENYLDMVIRDGHKPSVLSELLCCPFCGEIPEISFTGKFVRCIARSSDALKKDCVLAISGIWFDRSQWQMRAI